MFSNSLKLKNGNAYFIIVSVITVKADLIKESVTINVLYVNLMLKVLNPVSQTLFDRFSYWPLRYTRNER